MGNLTIVWCKALTMVIVWNLIALEYSISAIVAHNIKTKGKHFVHPIRYMECIGIFLNSNICVCRRELALSSDVRELTGFVSHNCLPCSASMRYVQAWCIYAYTVFTPIGGKCRCGTRCDSQDHHMQASKSTGERTTLAVKPTVIQSKIGAISGPTK